MSGRVDKFADEGGSDYREDYREHIRQELKIRVDELRRIHADLERIVEDMRLETLPAEEGQ